MLFNSFLFWIFFLAVILAYHMIGYHRLRLQNRLLLIASYLFYGTWDWRFLSLIWISTIIDYFVAGKINCSSGRERKLWLALSLVVNLGLLGFFKYFGFFATSFQDLFATIGINLSLPALQIVLPVGISFYTFQTMSYTIDVYRGVTPPVRNFLDFALYVAFFPQLVAGPIERSSRLMPQILKPRRRNGADFSEGLYLVILGLFKKVVIADNMALIANAVFNTSFQELSGFECMVGVYAFAFQIYGDFSGYSAIARGVARWLGFDLMVNFRMPYFAISPKDFWSRWHISLSTWLRDYLYIPLGGNRGSRWFTTRNLMLTMLLGGLWHGAGWTFIAWGAMHGLMLVVFRELSRFWNVDDASRRSFFANLSQGLLTFQLVCVTWLLFRADTITQAWGMLIRILTDFRITELGLTALWIIVFITTPLLIYEYWLERGRNLELLLKRRWILRLGVYSYAILMLLFFHPAVHNEFIYFQF